MSTSGPALSQLDQLFPIRPCTKVIYSRQFNYTQHTAGFTENCIGPPHLSKLTLTYFYVFHSWKTKHYHQCYNNYMY